MKLKAIVVDDEEFARKNLTMLLNEFCPEIEVVGEASGKKDAINTINELSPDVVFLDIRMPSGAEGFELLDEIENKNFLVVFVTAFKDYAVRAFNASAVYYLLKPIDIEELVLATKRLVETKTRYTETPGNYQTYFESLKDLSTNLLNNEQTVDENIAFDTAVFYSISNCQSGLAGISFGNFLIKQVVEDLTNEFENLKTFVTLSPIPLLQAWFENEGAKMKQDETNNLSKLAAFYLLNGKRDDGLPFDPVARFHLGNGAQVHAVHENADISEKGINQSQGMMVNYLYDPSMIGINHEKFVSENIIPASNEIISLSKSVVKVE